MGRGRNGAKFVKNRAIRLVSASRTEVEEAPAQYRTPVHGDPRVLWLKKIPGSNKRGRSWECACEGNQAEAVDDDPIDGARIIRPTMESFRASGKTPTQHSELWARATDLAPDAPAALRHMFHAETSDDGAVYEQVGLRNLTNAEQTARNWALTEWEERKKTEVKQLANDGKPGATAIERG